MSYKRWLIALTVFITHAYAGIHLHATVVNKLKVNDTKDQDVGTLVMYFKAHEPMTIDVDDFMASPEGQALRPIRGVVHIQRQGDGQQWLTAPLPKACLSPIKAGQVLRVYGQVKRQTVHHIRCTLKSAPTPDQNL